MRKYETWQAPVGLTKELGIDLKKLGDGDGLLFLDYLEMFSGLVPKTHVNRAALWIYGVLTGEFMSGAAKNGSEFSQIKEYIAQKKGLDLNAARKRIGDVVTLLELLEKGEDFRQITFQMRMRGLGNNQELRSILEGVLFLNVEPRAFDYFRNIDPQGYEADLNDPNMPGWLVKSYEGAKEVESQYSINQEGM